MMTTTSDEDRCALLRIARWAIEAHLSGSVPPSVEAEASLARRTGAFVTIYSEGRLRGCIGYVEPDFALVQVVARCAVAASSTDPRFPAVTQEELPHLSLEISILGPLEPAGSLDDIEVGRHGLAVEDNDRRGLLLPQVCREFGWDAAGFVAQVCLKAGLARDAWPGTARLWRFEAEVFSEDAYVARGR